MVYWVCDGSNLKKARGSDLVPPSAGDVSPKPGAMGASAYRRESGDMASVSVFGFQVPFSLVRQRLPEVLTEY